MSVYKPVNIKQSRVSVIVITYNAKDDVRDCLLSLAVQEVPIEIIIVDNASTDGTREMLTNEFAGWANIRLILNDENIGFAKGNNQALPYCNGEYILLLNSDTVVPRGGIAEMVKYMDLHPDVGVLGPRMVNENGIVQLSYGRFWSLIRDVAIAPILGSAYLERLPIIRWWKNQISGRKEVSEVDWIGGAAFMIRKQLMIDLGGIDPFYFLSAGDMVDLCMRVKKKGYKRVYYPNVEFIHKGSKSISFTRTTRTASLAHSYDGTIYFFKKHHGKMAALLARLLLILISLAKATIASLIAIGFGKPYNDIAYAHMFNALRLMKVRHTDVQYK